jgi:hypothetical protein
MVALLLGFLLFATVGLFLVLPVVLGWDIYDRYRDSRVVICPDTKWQVAVRFDAVHAAVTSMDHSKPQLRLADCTLWPARARCAQKCIPDALKTGPDLRNEVTTKEKKIYHLPVLIAAFLAWIFGALWHSQFVFRWLWADSVGLSRADIRTIVEWWAPHLLSAGMLLLFSYGVAWLLALSGWRGVWRGMVASLFSWILIVAVGLAVFAGTGLSIDLLTIELGYTFLASLGIGAIIGGLSGRLIASRFEEKLSH